MTDAPSTAAYKLKVSVLHISPMIWRRVVVPADLMLYGLHRVFQIAFGWEDYHLHAFHVSGRRYGTEWTGQRHYRRGDDGDLHEVRLSDLPLRVRGKFVYEYDFGDFWEHEVRLEERAVLDPSRAYPVCTAGARAGPPEDVGGPDGYERLLQRQSDWHYDLSMGPDRPYEDGIPDDLEAEWTDDERWTIAARLGFDGDDDPLLRYDPATFDRRAVNSELRREFASNPTGEPQASGQPTGVAQAAS